jgi:SAM-dependent methyltransferase
VNRELFVAHARLEERHWWFTARRAILRALLHAISPPGRGTALVDIGCGTGGNVAAFAAEYDALGVDPSADALELARERYPGVTFLQGDDPAVARGHLARGGVLMMTDVLEHVVDDQSLFDQALATLPSGGTMLITVPNDPALWSPHDELFGHSRRYTTDTLRALWRNAAVDERLLSPFNARLQPVIALIRRFRRHHRVRPGGDLGLSAGPLNGLLRRIFAGEAGALVAAIDRGAAPFARGVSLVAVVGKR